MSDDKEKVSPYASGINDVPVDPTPNAILYRELAPNGVVLCKCEGTLLAITRCLEMQHKKEGVDWLNWDRNTFNAMDHCCTEARLKISNNLKPKDKE